ncbi:hypothetical protein [Streptomyces antibioticus]|uniref:hypothetical protein n=1 Tax=Streptomyces antibioticus TaxID=1890 RepID=UPI0015C4CB58|nr:hypothetical protein [Streptomyces antibioticus]
MDEAALPGDHRRILAIVRAAGGLVQVRAVGEKLEPLRTKLVKLADRGWRSRPLTDDLHRSHPPTTSMSTSTPPHTRPVNCNFTMHTAHWGWW